jgi:hypothetical protein
MAYQHPAWRETQWWVQGWVQLVVAPFLLAVGVEEVVAIAVGAEVGAAELPFCEMVEGLEVDGDVRGKRPCDALCDSPQKTRMTLTILK